MVAPPPTGPLCTQDTLVHDLQRLGVRQGEVILLHSSLRSIGWVSGGPEAVVRALLEVVGPHGTLVVPSQTGHNSDPAEWKEPPVPETWHETIRATLPAFIPTLTPSRKMGAIAEMVRTWPGAERSANPQSSFAAIGPLAASLLADHALDCRLGERSPLAKLEKADARVLLLGATYMKCTCFHLGEYRSGAKRGKVSFAMQSENGRQWMTVDDVLLNGERFDDMGAALEERGFVATGMVGAATTKLFRLVDAVAHATQWLPEHRPS